MSPEGQFLMSPDTNYGPITGHVVDATLIPEHAMHTSNYVR